MIIWQENKLILIWKCENKETTTKDITGIKATFSATKVAQIWLTKAWERMDWREEIIEMRGHHSLQYYGKSEKQRSKNASSMILTEQT